jgi:hypothetical protein
MGCAALTHATTGVRTTRAPGEKSFFGSFFSKKELLAFLPLAFLPLAIAFPLIAHARAGGLA